MYNDDVYNNMKEFKSLNDFIGFISKNTNRITKYSEMMLGFIEEMQPEGHVNLIELYDTLFFNRESAEELREIDYDILRKISNKTRIENLDEIPDKYFTLYLLLLDKSHLVEIETQFLGTSEKYKLKLSAFLHVMFDLYIPSHNPTSQINDLIINKNMNLANIIELEYLYPIGNIYKMDECRFDAFIGYFLYNNIAIDFYGKLDKMILMFEGYIPVNKLIDYIYEILLTITELKNVSELDLVVRNIINSMIKRDIYKEPIFHALLLEILYTSRKTIDLYNYNEYLSYIKSKKYLEEKKEVVYDIVDESVMYYSKDDGLEYVIEKFKASQTLHDGQKKVYKLFKKYEAAEGKVDSQLTKLVEDLKKLFVGDIRTEVIEGKKYTVLGVVKKVFASAAIFSIAPIKSLMLFVVRYYTRKNITISERKKIILELEAELELIEEKIEDARGDGNKKARYALIRTKTELTNAIRKIKLGLEADQKSIDTAKAVINK